MEKLIKLLNEYEPYIQKDGERHDNIWYFVYKGGSAIFPREIGILKIISKEYGFIKWLVENDKIDYNKVLISFTMSESDGLGNYYGHGVEVYQGILMLLAIQDKPVDYLTSILK